MKLLVISQYYWPEPFNFAEMCEGLVSFGHDVTVLAGIPNYPEGEIYPEYRTDPLCKEEHNGVHVVRIKQVPRHTGPIYRFLNYSSFAANAKKVALGLGPDFDAVIVLQISPVHMAKAAVAYSQHYGVPLLHYVIDIWPECLLTGGIKKGSVVYNHYKRLSARLYGSADVLAVSSPQFKSYLSDELAITNIRTVDLPQYAEDIFDGEPDCVPEDYDSDKFNVTFAGNIGAAQSVQTLVRAAAIMRENEHIAFHIVGTGSELDACKQMAQEEDLLNVTFHGRRPLSEMPGYYAASSAMIATFADSPVLGFTLPRKVQSYMAAGRPVIAAAPGETARVINEACCGVVCGAEDPYGLANACGELAAMTQEDLAAMGAAGRAYYREKFTKEQFLRTLNSELERLKGTKHREQ